MKGTVNDLTEIMTEAQELIERIESDLTESYGQPLFTTDQGRGRPVWPSDPDTMAPEEMALLIQTRGEEAVNAWLTEHFTAKAEREALEGDD